MGPRSKVDAKSSAPAVEDKQRNGLRVAFVHPDLGLGGAERLIVDAASELVRLGYVVDVYTAYFDPKRCFEECRPVVESSTSAAEGGDHARKRHGGDASSSKQQQGAQGIKWQRESLPRMGVSEGGFRVIVAGGWFPRHLFGGRMVALCAYIRCLLAAIWLAWQALTNPSSGRCDVVICDQVSVVVPVLRWLLGGWLGWRWWKGGDARGRGTKILFYCHFPDLLLAQGREASALKRAYRAPLDWVEQTTTGMAHLVLVNSRFTRSIFDKTFSRLAAAGVRPEVLYPAVSLPSDASLTDAEAHWRKELDPALVRFITQQSGQPGKGGGGGEGQMRQGGGMLLSINRFERKKGIGLAIRALAAVIREADQSGGVREGNRGAKGQESSRGGGGGEDRPTSSPSRAKGRGDGNTAAATATKATASPSRGVHEAAPRTLVPSLVIAGGYDVRLAENREHLEELKALARSEGLEDRVWFLPSFSDRQRSLLLAACTAVLYTPPEEHFGIVPLEAMASGRPVVACNSGGPLESVVEGETGFLCPPVPGEWAKAIQHLLQPGVAESMGHEARQHVTAKFSRESFGASLDGYIRGLIAAAATGAGRRGQEAQGPAMGGNSKKGRRNRED